MHCVFILINYNFSINNQLNWFEPFHYRKKNLLRFSPDFYHNMNAFHGFQIRKTFCDIFCCCQDIGEILVYRFIFNSVHFVFTFFNFDMAKSVYPLEFESV